MTQFSCDRRDCRELLYGLAHLLGWEFNVQDAPRALGTSSIPPATTMFFELHYHEVPKRMAVYLCSGRSLGYAGADLIKFVSGKAPRSRRVPGARGAVLEHSHIFRDQEYCEAARLFADATALVHEQALEGKHVRSQCKGQLTIGPCRFACKVSTQSNVTTPACCAWPDCPREQQRAIKRPTGRLDGTEGFIIQSKPGGSRGCRRGRILLRQNLHLDSAIRAARSSVGCL